MTITWLDLLVKGGFLMVPIGACSLVALALIVDRAIHLLATRDDARRLDEALRLGADDPAEAIRLLTPPRGSVAALWRAGFQALPAGKSSIERAMQMEGSRQMERAERGMSLLGAVVALTPMLGFLGTIVGLIRAFMEWEHLGANVEVAALAGGMYEAMITTAAGLFVAIPGYLFCAILNSRIAARGRKLEIAHETFMQVLAPTVESRPLGSGGDERVERPDRSHRAAVATEPQLAPPAEVDGGEGDRS